MMKISQKFLAFSEYTNFKDSACSSWSVKEEPKEKLHSEGAKYDTFGGPDCVEKDYALFDQEVNCD